MEPLKLNVKCCQCVLFGSQRKVGVCSTSLKGAVLCLVAQPRPTFCDPMDCSPPGSSVQRDSPGKDTGVGCHALCQGIFPTQGSNPGLPHCRWILYCLSHHGSPRILEWVVYPSPGDLPDLGIELRRTPELCPSLPRSTCLCHTHTFYFSELLLHFSCRCILCFPKL